MTQVYIVEVDDIPEDEDGDFYEVQGIFTDLEVLKCELFAQGLNFDNFEMRYADEDHEELDYAYYENENKSRRILVTPMRVNMLNDIIS